MKYVCLIFPEAPVSGGGALEQRSAEAGGDLRARIVMGAQAIGAANSAVTVRVRGVDMSIVEGAARRRGEPSPRYRLLEAVDLNDAIRLASLLPEALVARLELRPILSLPVAGSRRSEDRRSG